jgi:hypothetical protein
MGTENIRLGTCKILVGVKGSEVDLGLTIGGVEVEVTTDTQPTVVDQFGDTVVKETIRGRNVMIRTQLAETTLDNMVAIMPGAEKVTDGSDPQKIKVVVKTGVGTDLLGIAQRMVLHPVELAASNVSEDFVIPKAATAGGLSFAYSKDNERVFNTEYRGYPDEDGVLFIFGDETAVV